MLPALSVTETLPAMPPAPVPVAAPVEAVSPVVRILPEVVLEIVIEPALPPFALPAVPAPPLAPIAAVVTPPIEVICTVPPAPPAKLAPLPLEPLAVIPAAVSPFPVKVTLPALLPAEFALAAPPELVIAPVTFSSPLVAVALIAPPAPLTPPVVVSAVVATVVPANVMLPAVPLATVPEAPPLEAVIATVFNVPAVAELPPGPVSSTAPPAPPALPATTAAPPEAVIAPLVRLRFTPSIVTLPALVPAVAVAALSAPASRGNSFGHLNAACRVQLYVASGSARLSRRRNRTSLQQRRRVIGNIDTTHCTAQAGTHRRACLRGQITRGQRATSRRIIRHRNNTGIAPGRNSAHARIAAARRQIAGAKCPDAVDRDVRGIAARIVGTNAR